MVKSLSRLFMATAVLGIAVSCEKQGESGMAFGIGLTAHIEDFEVKGIASGTWDGGEEVAVRATLDGTVEIRKYNADAGGVLTAASGYEPFGLADEAGNMDIDVWYPYSESSGQWSVQDNQADFAAYQASDFIGAFNFSARAGSNDVTLYHQTARIIVNIMASAEVPSGDIAGIQIGKGNLALEGTFTPPAAGQKYGSWTTSGADGTIIPLESDASGVAAVSCQAIIIPQDMSGKDLVVVSLSNGEELVYTLPSDAGAFSAGGNYEFSLYAYKDGLSDEERDDSEYGPEDLKPGDYFYSDGTWSDGGLRGVTESGMVWEDEKPSPESGKTVIGIVFCTDQERIGQGEREALAAIGVSEPHGLVLSTISSTYNSYFTWYNKNGEYSRDETEIGLTEIGADLDGDEVYEKIDADIEGYRNNMLIRTERADDLAAGYYPGFKVAMNFAEEAGGPDASAKTTGWYIPSNGQLIDILRYLLGVDLNGSNFYCDTPGIIFWEGIGDTPARLNEIMSKVPSSQKVEYPGYNNALMSASQGNAETMRYIDFTESGYLDCLRDYKNRGTHIRCVLAF